MAIGTTTGALNAFAAASCGIIEDQGVWKLMCASDDADTTGDDYQCDFFIDVTHAASPDDQQEATGALEPGQTGVEMWSSRVYGGDVAVTSASIARGSCSR